MVERFPCFPRSTVAADFNAYGLKLSAAGEAFVAAVAIYLLLVAFGRLLKRRFGVRLGQVYQLFCAATGPYLAIAALYPSLAGRTELGSLSALLATGVFVRLVDQYFYRWYFEEKTRRAGSQVHPRGHGGGGFF